MRFEEPEEGGMTGTTLTCQPTQSVPIRVPGSRASTVTGVKTFHSLLRVVFRTDCRLSSFARSFAAQRFEHHFDDTAPTSLLPMPIPYPEVFERKNEKSSARQATKQIVVLLVIVLNYLHLNRARSVAGALAPKQRLNKRQWGGVRRLEGYVEAWTNVSPIGPAEMGRTAAKMEDLESLLNNLEKEAATIAKEYSYFPEGGAVDRGGDPQRAEGQAIGVKLGGTNLTTFKEIDSRRLTFAGRPSFDPTPYLDPQSQRIFLDPLTTRDPITPATRRPPRLRVHCSKSEKIRLFELLDSTDRLSFHAASDVTPYYGSGLFAVTKNLEKDRMILDSRGANLLESPPCRWIKSLASAELLTHYLLKPDEELLCSGNDLRDFYYFFKTTEARSRRNVLVGGLHPKSVGHLRALRPKHLENTEIFGCLNTLAMGDCQAVELAQSCHLGLALQNRITKKEELLALQKAVPRSGTAVGLVIDDFVTLSRRRIGEEGPTEGAEKAERMQAAYKAAGLMPNEEKSFRDESESTFWGADVHGRAGRVRGSLKRAIPLAALVIKMVEVGFGSTELLQTVTGCLISLFLYRRRFLSLLDSLFNSYRGRKPKEIIELSGRTKSDLLIMVTLLPVAAANIKANPPDRIYASDASGWGEAGVFSRVHEEIGVELTRHALRKSIWVRLLSPAAALERVRGNLEGADEVPEREEPYRSNPLWDLLARSLTYEKAFARAKKAPRHINIGELRAALHLERIGSLRRPSSRLLMGLDSQVALGALIKGRSSSPGLNAELCRSIPMMVLMDTSADYFYFNTKSNRADDPTRGVEIRGPDLPLPDWWGSVERKEYRAFDDWLKLHQLDEETMSGLPPMEELMGSVEECDEEAETIVTGGDDCRKEEFEESLAAVKHEKRASGQASNGAEKEAERKGRQEDEELETSTEAETTEAEITEARKIVATEAEIGSEDERRELRTPSAERLLAPEAREALLAFPKDQFVLPKGEEWPPRRPGCLDLFSGVRGVAEAAKKRGFWSLCFDLEHGPNEDLSIPALRRDIERLVGLGCFESVGGGPVCSSFSMAVTPAVRDRLHPLGKEEVSEKMAVKIAEGNDSAIWMFELLERSLRRGMQVWLENPSSSWMFKLPQWLQLCRRWPSLRFWTVDYCRYGAKWRKRTHFATTTSLGGTKVLCQGGHQHLLLRGRSKKDKMSWTRVAQAYPKGVAEELAASLIRACGYCERRKLHISRCAKAGEGRIGEASNPGPRRPRTDRREGLLTAVPLVEAKTRVIQSKTWRGFTSWMTAHLSSGAMESAFGQPALLVLLLEEYGNFLYSEGRSLYLYRHLVVLVQQSFQMIKPYMGPAWAMITKWEKMEPPSHRLPLPEALFRAMMTVSLGFGWTRFAAVLGLAFYGITRPSEPLLAARRNLILPSDRLEPFSSIAYLKIVKSKTSGRGNARIQHATIEHVEFVLFLQATFSGAAGSERIYACSGSAFRRRWDAILRCLDVPASAGLTPGGLRGGGCVAAYQSGCEMTKLLWKMRLKQLSTLENYLQEVSASTLIPSLPRGARRKIQTSSSLFDVYLRATTAKFCQTKCD